MLKQCLLFPEVALRPSHQNQAFRGHCRTGYRQNAASVLLIFNMMVFMAASSSYKMLHLTNSKFKATPVLQPCRPAVWLRILPLLPDAEEALEEQQAERLRASLLKAAFIENSSSQISTSRH